MAYLDLDFPFQVRIAFDSAKIAPLTALERGTILASRNDRTSSLQPGNPLSRVSAFFFGTTRKGRLADPRLEALRCYALLYRPNGQSLASDEADRLIAAGYAPQNLQMVHAV